MDIIIQEGVRAKYRGIYKIAGHVIQITSIFTKLHRMCEAYACSEEPEFSVITTMDDIAEEEIKAREEDALEGLSPCRYLKSLLELTAIYRKITDKLIEKGLFLFHGSVVAVDGAAYLFTAKSGTGKSTHTRLWREMFGERAVMVNDDKPLLELTERGVIAHGTPWNGKHNLGANISVPLKAICILTRGEENRIAPLEASRAFPMILQQSNRSLDENKMMKTLELLEETLRRVPVYRLQCNMDIEAAKVAYEGMQKKSIRNPTGFPVRFLYQILMKRIA